MNNPKKVLVAEDDSFLQSVYKVKLEKEGYDFRIVSDGAAALEMLKSFVPDLILLDLIMPGIDGFALLEKLKSDPSFKNIPVVVTSNLGQDEDIQRALKLGAKDYIVKSDTPISELMKKLETYF